MFPVDQSKTTSSLREAEACAIARHRELILEIRALRSAIEKREGGVGRSESQSTQPGEIHRLRHELDLIHAAIAAAKQDLDASQSCKPEGIAGRRIVKVVATLKFVADHIVNMMEIASQNEVGRDFTSAAMTRRPRERRASAPRTDASPGPASPYDIEALLA
jgi:hypothetical protein